MEMKVFLPALVFVHFSREVVEKSEHMKQVYEGLDRFGLLM